MMHENDVKGKSVSTNKVLLKHSHSLSVIICIIYGCFLATKAELSRGARDLGQSLKYFPFCPLQKKFADPRSRH